MSPSEKLVCFRVVTVTFMQREMPAYDEFGFSPQGILPNPKQRRLPSTQRLVPTIAAHIRCPFSLLVMKVPLSLTEAKSLDGFSILRQLSENAHGNLFNGSIDGKSPASDKHCPSGSPSNGSIPAIYDIAATDQIDRLYQNQAIEVISINHCVLLCFVMIQRCRR